MFPLQDPIVRPLHELDSNALQKLLPEIPFWLKNPDYDRVSLFPSRYKISIMCIFPYNNSIGNDYLCTVKLADQFLDNYVIKAYMIGVILLVFGLIAVCD